MENLNKAIAPPKLHLYNAIPEHLADIPVEKLDSILPGPSLIYIKGKVSPPIFISVLLHGNEITGFLAIQHLIKELSLTSRPAPRGIILFIGNIAAAKKGMRRLENEPDYNRIWNGGLLPEHYLAGAVLEKLSAKPLYAAIDIHNNTGKNPHYACINRTDPSFIHLARRFSKTIVYFTEPHEVISMALSHLCPSVTLECGFSGDVRGLNHVCNYLIQSLTMPAGNLFSPPSNKQSEIYHTIAKITVPDNAHLGFGNCKQDVDMCFRNDLEALNFTTVPTGTKLGVTRAKECTLHIADNDNRDVTGNYIMTENNALITRKPLVPSMFTQNKTIIHQDCLGYIMEPYPMDQQKGQQR